MDNRCPECTSDLVVKSDGKYCRNCSWFSGHISDVGVMVPWEELDRALSSEKSAIAEMDSIKLKLCRAMRCLKDIHALVLGGRPSLLDEDCGGDEGLDMMIREIIAEDNASIKE